MYQAAGALLCRRLGKGRRARSAGDGARRYNPPTVQPGKLNKVEALGASGTQDDQNANPGQAEVFEVGHQNVNQGPDGQVRAGTARAMLSRLVQTRVNFPTWSRNLTR